MRADFDITYSEPISKQKDILQVLKGRIIIKKTGSLKTLSLKKESTSFKNYLFLFLPVGTIFKVSVPLICDPLKVTPVNVVSILSLFKFKS